MATVGVVIPALNAARHLGPLLDEIRALHPELRLLVVDDGSSDGTAQTARDHGAETIVHPVNRGKGAALLTGFAWAGAEGLDWVVTMDADGQHRPADLAGFLAHAAADDVDVVVGDRMADTAAMPWVRLATNRFTSFVVSRLAGTPIPDSQNGYRMIRTRLLHDLRLTTANYDMESEILVRLARRGARVASTPTATVYGDETSAIHPVRDTIRFFRLAARLRREKGSAP